MTSEVLTQSVTVGNIATFGRGRIFNVLQASSPVSIILETKSTRGGQTNVRKFSNIPAGSKFTLKPTDEDWTYLRLTSAVNQSVTLFVGDDDMTFSNAVTVTGVAVVSVNPSSTVADTAPISPSATGQHPLVAANATRKRVTIYADPANTATVYIRVAGGANDIGFVQAGTYEEFDTLVGLDYRDPSAGGQKLYIFDES
jgi:hypothetical protein